MGCIKARCLKFDMQDSVAIRLIEPGDEAAVTELHRKHYWRGNCLLLNRDFYRWQFELAPDSLAAGGDKSVVAVDAASGQLLSFLGVVPARALFQGKPIRAAHLITWLSAPEARGRGVGLAIMKYMTSEYEFLFGRSVTPAALAIYRRLGMRYFLSCRRWLAVLDAEATLSLAVEPDDASRKRAQARAVRVQDAVPAHVDRRVPEGADSLASEVLAGALSFERTHDYLQWRYQSHPYLKYEFLSVGGTSELEGFAVVRVEDVSGRPGRVLRVVEFIATRLHSLKLARAVFHFGLTQGCAYADMFGMSERFAAGFVAAGGYDSMEEPELRLPHLLQPWDPATEAPGLLFYGKRDEGWEGGLRPADDISMVHVSKGDGNFDWPSWVPTAEGNLIAPQTESVA